MVWYIWLKFCLEYECDLDVQWYEKWKKSEAESGHSDRLKIKVDPSKIYVDPGIWVLKMT